MHQQFLGNTLGEYIWFIGWIVGAFIFKRPVADALINIFSKIFKKRLYGVSAEKLQSILSRSLSIFIFIVLIFVAVQPIHFPDSWNFATAKGFGIKGALVILYGVIFGISLTHVILKIIGCIGLITSRKYETEERKSSVSQVVPFATDFIKIIIAVLAGLIIISTIFHINVGAIVAGLGIGGLAIALAAKDTFQNLLGSFIIYFDKPFLIGEFIYINDTYCTVDKVGLRSTRFRTIYRTYMTLPNNKVVESAIYNYTMRDMRRADRIVQLSRKTTHSQITSIIAEIREFIDQNERASSDSLYINFHEISDISLDIRLQYYVIINDWSVYLEVVEEVNLKLLEIIEKNDAELAYPTRTIRMNENWFESQPNPATGGEPKKSNGS
jgi:MscS family membrane protein